MKNQMKFYQITRIFMLIAVILAAIMMIYSGFDGSSIIPFCLIIAISCSTLAEYRARNMKNSMMLRQIACIIFLVAVIIAAIVMINSGFDGLSIVAFCIAIVSFCANLAEYVKAKKKKES